MGKEIQKDEEGTKGAAKSDHYSREGDRIAKERERYRDQKRRKRINGDGGASTLQSTPREIKHGVKIEYVGSFLKPSSIDTSGIEAEDARKRLGIAVRGPKGVLIPRPITSWEDERIPDEVFARFYKKHADVLKEPTTVQSQLWPCALSGWDALAVSPTGSGKTLAFALPLAMHVQGNRTQNRYHSCLVLAPTRELVAQIAKTMKRFPKLFGVSVLAIYGGEPYDPEVLAQADIVVATPGRCLDASDARHLRLENVTCLVMDEADRMLQLGFQDALEAIIPQMPPNRQTILTTATWTGSAVKVAGRWLKTGHVEIFVGSLPGSDQMQLEGGRRKRGEDQDPKVESDAGEGEGQDAADGSDVFQGGAMTLSKEIEQIIHVCAEHKKPRKLIRHIERVRKEEAERGHSRNPGPMLIFCNKIKTVLFVYEFLARQNVRVVAIHGGMPQDKRERALAEFRAGKYNCLVATDVAGRGLHIPNLVHVVNYDFPTSLAQYAHRAGRCGRGKLKGTAFSFFTRNLAVMSPDLVKLLQLCNQTVDPNLKSLAKEYEEHGMESFAALDQYRDEPTLQGDDDPEESDGEPETAIGGKAEKDLHDEIPDESPSSGAEEPPQRESMDNEEQQDGLTSDNDEDVASAPADENEAFHVEQWSDDDERESLKDGDEDYIEDAKLDSIGAVPLKSFKPVLPTLVESKKKNKLKRPRGVRGGKKSKSKRPKVTLS